MAFHSTRRTEFFPLTLLSVLLLIASACASDGSETEPAAEEEPAGEEDPAAGPAGEEDTEPEAEPEPEPDGEAADEPEPQAADDEYANYPERDIEVIIPFGEGGASSRINTAAVVPAVNELFDFRMRPVHMPGAAGIVGSGYVAEAEPDGYTIMSGSITQFLGIETQDAGFTSDDLTVVAITAEPGQGIMVKHNSPFDTIEEFIEYSRENPGQLTAAVTSATGINAVTATAVAEEIGVEWVHVPFDSGGDLAVAVQGETTDFTVSAMGPALENPENWKILASITAERHPDLPDVPTLVELGYDVDIPILRLAAVPAATPEPIKHKLSDIYQQITESEAYREPAFQIEGEPPTFRPYPEAEERVKSMLDRLQPVLETLRE